MVDRLLLLALSGCAQEAVEKRLDEKVAQTPPITSRHQLDAREKTTLDSSDLKPEQKKALQKIHDAYLQESQAVEADSLKLRAILIKDITTPDYDQDEVKAIENRLRSLEDRRVAAISHAIRDANHELGRWDVGSQGQVDAFIGETYVNGPMFH